MANYIGTWKNVITNPTLFFEKMPISGGYIEPIRFVLINFLLGVIILMIQRFLIEPYIYRGSLIDFTLNFSIFLLIVGVAGLFINCFILFIYFKIMGGNGSYEGSFRLLAYSSAPIALPIFPIWVFYSLYLMIVGGERVHNVSKSCSAIVVLLPIIVVLSYIFYTALTFPLS